MAYSNINKPNEYFTPTIYTGTGATQSITSLDFQPDLVWIKGRSVAYNHRLFDSIRGAGKKLSSDTTSAEVTDTNEMSAFLSNGFTLGSDAGTNGSGATYASWNWLAGGTGVSNTQGSITSTISANTTSGFSIATYTGNQSSGATFGHGLGTTPSCFIIKCTSTADIWVVYHKSLGGGDNYLRLNTTGATYTGDNVFASTAPSSSLITLGDVTSTNYSGRTYVCYSFAEKKGFSKFGKYTGNGSTDGTFVYTGFKPAFVMIKLYNTTVDNWYIQDSKRLGYNFQNPELRPNSNNTENTDANNNIDFLSNGFKMRTSNGDTNSNGVTFIYMAFAENPLVAGNYVPTTAR